MGYDRVTGIRKRGSGYDGEKPFLFRRASNPSGSQRFYPRDKRKIRRNDCESIGGYENEYSQNDSSTGSCEVP